MNPDQLAELEEQRRFLLRSITDLDREHLYGDVDDHDYETLRDGYTARAASVMRAIEDGHDRGVGTGGRAGRRSLLRGSSAPLLVASLAGWLVARTSGQRLPGQSISGGLPGDEVAQKLAEARQLLGVDPQQAIVRYQQVRELDPNNAEALTYMGWLIAQSGSRRGVRRRVPAWRDQARPDLRRPALLPGDHLGRLPAAARHRRRRAARRRPASTTTHRRR